MLSLTDRKRELRVATTVIRKAFDSVLAMARALRDVKDRELYSATHGSFKDWAADEFGMQKTHAYRMIGVAEVADDLEEIVEADELPMPSHETLYRQLRELPPAERGEAWRDVLSNVPTPTEKAIKLVVEARMAREDEEDEPEPVAGELLMADAGVSAVDAAYEEGYDAPPPAVVDDDVVEIVAESIVAELFNAPIDRRVEVQRELVAKSIELGSCVCCVRPIERQPLEADFYGTWAVQEVRKKRTKQASKYSADFEKLWEMWPNRKQKKGDAFKSWKRAIKDIKPSYILDAVREYAESAEGQSPFCPSPAPWLNQERWDDDRESWHRDQDEPTKTQSTLNAAANYVESRQ